jgi:hypothetical protein
VNVDTVHGIFVCTACSGIHREFGDRIKSVSMAAFSADDVKLLQQQTNDQFNAIWMAKWKSEIPLPLNAPDDKRRSFLIAKYQEKRWFSAAPKRKPTPVAEPPPAATTDSLVDDLLTFDAAPPVSPAPNQPKRDSLLDLTRMIADAPPMPLPEFPPSADVLRRPAPNGFQPGYAFSPGVTPWQPAPTSSMRDLLGGW